MAEKVSIEDLEVAIEWLAVNEGVDDDDDPDKTEMASCRRVSEYLKAEIAKRMREAAIRTLVKGTGRSPAAIRTMMKAKGL